MSMAKTRARSWAQPIRAYRKPSWASKLSEQSNLSDGSGDYTFEMIVSSVGWQTPNEVEIRIDGNKMELEGVYTSDRSFFTLKSTMNTLAPGKHKIEVSENVHNGDNVLAFAELYAHGPGYDFSDATIAAFPTFDTNGSMAGYRPTHNTCLMRNMPTAQGA